MAVALATTPFHYIVSSVINLFFRSLSPSVQIAVEEILLIQANCICRRCSHHGLPNLVVDIPALALATRGWSSSLGSSWTDTRQRWVGWRLGVTTNMQQKHHTELNIYDNTPTVQLTPPDVPEVSRDVYCEDNEQRPLLLELPLLRRRVRLPRRVLAMRLAI